MSAAAAEPTAPDFVEAIEVWKAWRVAERDGAFHLQSVLKPTIWPHRRPLVAECLHPENGPARVWRRSCRHTAPELGCDCGIYGAGLSQVAPYLTPAPFQSEVIRVLGRVSLWGTVVECERGYRASNAYPLSIYVPVDSTRGGRLAEEIAFGLVAYGMPVELLSEPSTVAAAALERQLSLSIEQGKE
jgi:hypothetical protein